MARGRVVGDADPYGLAKTVPIRETVTNGAPRSVRPTMGARKPVTPGGGGTPPLQRSVPDTTHANKETAEEMWTFAASTTSVDNEIKRRPKGGCYLILNR